MDRAHVDLLELLQRAQAEVTDRIDAVEAHQWDDAVLPGWTVVDLVAHLVGEQLRVPLLLGGETAEQARAAVPTDTEELVAGDPLGSWESAADGALTAWARPGAMAGTVHLAGGPVPATQLAARATTDLAVHAWDLARATGGQTRLGHELVAFAAAHAGRDPGPDGLPGRAGAASAVPLDADPQVRLLAARGRRP